MIDYAKTLYKPEFPHEINEQISKFTSTKLPAFFEYAKGKEKSQVMERNVSFVNKIYDRIPDRPVNTRGLNLGQLDPLVMMSDKRIICSQEVADLYDELNRKYRYMSSSKDEDHDNLPYVACKIRESFRRTGYSDEILADMLVEYLYGRNKRCKQLLWFCYGQYIANNIEKNLKARGELKKTKYVQCADCGEWLELPMASKSKRCEKCTALYQREKTRLRVQKYRDKREKNYPGAQGGI